MELKNKKAGFAVTGSFCTLSRAMQALETVAAEGVELTPIMSEITASTDTRFGKASEFEARMRSICKRDVIKNVKEAEPIGPKAMFDILIVLPCTGNTLAKIASGVADTSVTMAVKAHLRNQRPVLIAVSTNDGLGTAAQNIGALLNRKNIYLLPFGQDDCVKKPNSLVADFDALIPAAEAALDQRQIQPVIL